MAVDAADRLRELIAAGEEIPYEVREPGDGSPLCRYEPLTELFVHDHAGELRELDSFGAACAALETAGLAGAYLERMGIGVPEDAAQARRARRHRLPLPPLDGQLRLLARATTRLDGRDRRGRGRRRRRRRRDRGDRPAARPADAGRPPRPRRPPRSSAPTPSTCPPRRARATASGSRRGSPPSSPSSASTSADDDDGERRGRARRGRVLPPPDHHPAPVQGRRRRARAARLDPHRAATAGAGSRPAPGASVPAATG